MPKQFRMKMQCGVIASIPDGGGRVMFYAVQDPDATVDEKFAQGAEGGHLDVFIDSPRALDKLRVGHVFDVVFSR